MKCLFAFLLTALLPGCALFELFGPSWQYVGDQNITTNLGVAPSLAVRNGVPYLAFVDGSFGYGIRVMTWSNGRWLDVGEPRIGGADGSSPSLAFSGSGNLFLAFSEKSDPASAGKASVFLFANGRWQPVGNPQFSLGSAGGPSLAFDGDTPYVAYRDGSFEPYRIDGMGGKPTMMRFNGSNWEVVGQPGFDSNSVRYVSAGVLGNIPVVACDTGVFFYKSNTWTELGSNSKTGSFCRLSIDGFVPWVAYAEYSQGNRATVRYFSNETWISAGNPGFSEEANREIGFMVQNGDAWIAVGGDQLNTFRFTNSEWKRMNDETGLNSHRSDIDLRIDQGIPWISYTSESPSVMVFK